MPRIRLLLVDDHEIVRLGLRAVLERESDLEVVGEADDGDAAIVAAGRLAPHVIVMDVRMQTLSGIDACRAIKATHPEIAVLFLTSFGTEEAVMAALMAGAAGFLLKNSTRSDLLRAIRVVAGGDSLLDPAVTRQVMGRLLDLASRDEDPRIRDLTHREREVLARIAHGDTNRQIAERLVISDATAKNHVSHVLEKLGLNRRSEAAALAATLGLST